MGESLADVIQTSVGPQKRKLRRWESIGGELAAEDPKIRAHFLKSLINLCKVGEAKAVYTVA